MRLIRYNYPIYTPDQHPRYSLQSRISEIHLNHPIQIIRSCSLISASKIIARQPPFHQNKIKNVPSCFFTNSPDAFFYTIPVDPRCPEAQPASRHSDPGALFRLTFTVYAPVHSLFPVSQLEHMRQFLLRSGDAPRILTVDHVGDLLRKIDMRAASPVLRL